MSKTSKVVLAGMVCLLATTWTMAALDGAAADPLKERYCDPNDTFNAKQLDKIKVLKEKLAALQIGDPKSMALINKIAIADRKMNCSYRSIQED